LPRVSSCSTRFVQLDCGCALSSSSPSELT
jgi:hypothetical protein